MFLGPCSPSFSRIEAVAFPIILPILTVTPVHRPTNLFFLGRIFVGHQQLLESVALLEAGAASMVLEDSVELFDTLLV